MRMDVTFEESVPFYRLFPYRTAPLPPLALFLAPGPNPVDPLPPPGPAPSGSAAGGIGAGGAGATSLGGAGVTARAGCTRGIRAAGLGGAHTRAGGHSLSAPPSNKSVEPSGLYPELVGCLTYLMTCTRPDLAYPLSILVRYVAPGIHRPEHSEAFKRVLRYLCSTSGMGLVLGGRGPVVLTRHANASWVDDLATQRLSQGYNFSLAFGSVSRREAGQVTIEVDD
ncbi:unnamed protein product [Closterium sp. NIES-54]